MDSRCCRGLTHIANSTQRDCWVLSFCFSFAFRLLPFCLFSAYGLLPFCLRFACGLLICCLHFASRLLPSRLHSALHFPRGKIRFAAFFDPSSSPQSLAAQQVERIWLIAPLACIFAYPVLTFCLLFAFRLLAVCFRFAFVLLSVCLLFASAQRKERSKEKKDSP